MGFLSKAGGLISPLTVGTTSLLRKGLRAPASPDVPELTEQERRIIARMKELATGDPELLQVYQDFTTRAIGGEEGITPALERDIREAEAIEKERIARGLGPTGDIASTPGIKRMGRFKESAISAREAARRGAIATGEAALAGEYGRRITAGGAALGPYAQQRGLAGEAARQRWINEAATTAGNVGLATTLGTAYLTGKRRPGLTGPREPETMTV